MRISWVRISWVPPSAKASEGINSRAAWIDWQGYSGQSCHATFMGHYPLLYLYIYIDSTLPCRAVIFKAFLCRFSSGHFIGISSMPVYHLYLSSISPVSIDGFMAPPSPLNLSACISVSRTWLYSRDLKWEQASSGEGTSCIEPQFVRSDFFWRVYPGDL